MSQAIEIDTEFGTDTPQDGAPNISRAEIHEVLSNERRIALLELLSEESPRELGALAEAIAAAETGESPPPRNKRQSAYVTLHQTHLPKLDDLDIVEYDAREKVVALSEQAPLVFRHDADDETGRTDERETPAESERTEPVDAGIEPYLGLVVGGLLASFGSAAGVAPFSAFSLSAYALATLVALLVGFAYRLGRDGSTAPGMVRQHRR